MNLIATTHTTTHSGSRRWVNEVRPVACGPQREAHFLRTAHKLQWGEKQSSAVPTSHHEKIRTRTWKHWLSEAAGLCPALPPPPHGGRSSAWPSQPWWERWAPRGTAAPDLTQCRVHRWDDFQRFRWINAKYPPSPLFNSSGQEFTEQSVPAWLKYCSALWTLLDTGPSFPWWTNTHYLSSSEALRPFILNDNVEPSPLLFNTLSSRSIIPCVIPITER